MRKRWFHVCVILGCLVAAGALYHESLAHTGVSATRALLAAALFTVALAAVIPE